MIYKNKVYVCNRCRKTITYSRKQAGLTVPCPFCGTPATFPADKDFPPEHESRNNNGRLLFVLSIVAIAGASTCFLIKSGASTLAEIALKDLSSLPSNLFDPAVVVAPRPARVHGVKATVAVTEVQYKRPDIYYAALKKSAPAETPVCCVKLEIANTGKKSVAFHSWRIFESFGDRRKAVLTDVNGFTNSLVSYGADTYPSCLKPVKEVAPGEMMTDWVFFLCRKKPASDLHLTLPCENLGSTGDVRVRIPCEMIQ